METNHSLKNFNWYPGHIAKAEKELKERIKVIDIIIELIDARIPEYSQHVDLPQWANNKPILKVLNKVDLADKEVLKQSFSKLLRISCKDINSIKRLVTEIEKLAEPIHNKFKAKGIIGKEIRVMILGYPNVGKSSLINALSRSRKAKVANKPGVTRQQQWIEMPSHKYNLRLLDTPGIIPTKLYSYEQALRLALTGTLGENAYDKVLVANAGLELMTKLYPQKLMEIYRFKDISEISLEQAARNLHFLKDSIEDTERMAQRFLSDLREAKFQGICL